MAYPNWNSEPDLLKSKTEDYKLKKIKLLKNKNDYEIF